MSLSGQEIFMCLLMSLSMDDIKEPESKATAFRRSVILAGSTVLFIYDRGEPFLKLWTNIP